MLLFEAAGFVLEEGSRSFTEGCHALGIDAEHNTLHFLKSHGCTARSVGTVVKELRQHHRANNLEIESPCTSNFDVSAELSSQHLAGFSHLACTCSTRIYTKLTTRNMKRIQLYYPETESTGRDGRECVKSSFECAIRGSTMRIATLLSRSQSYLVLWLTTNST